MPQHFLEHVIIECNMNINHSLKTIMKNIQYIRKGEL